MQSIVPSVTRDLSSRNEILRSAQDDLLSQVEFIPEPAMNVNAKIPHFVRNYRSEGVEMTDPPARLARLTASGRRAGSPNPTFK